MGSGGDGGDDGGVRGVGRKDGGWEESAGGIKLERVEDAGVQGAK